MQLHEGKQAVLDAAFVDYAEELRAAGDETAAVTLAYTHSLHRSWRTALRMLPVPAGWSVLDVGSGLGILSFELAANVPLDLCGVDIDPGFVGHSLELHRRLDAQQVFVPGATIRFDEGDILDLSHDDGTFHLLFVRELLQFLPEPETAVAELFRVLRPGGYACVSDTDDQLRITWPPASAAFDQLVGAVASVQHGFGGDRQTGRKLSSFLRRAGFDVVSVVVLPDAQHHVVDAGSAERALILEQLRDARSRVVAAGAMEAAEYDTALAALSAEEPHEEFRMNARIIVLGQKPEG